MESTIGGWVRSKLRVFEPRSDPCGVLGLRTDQYLSSAVSLRPRDLWRRPSSSFVFIWFAYFSSCVDCCGWKTACFWVVHGFQAFSFFSALSSSSSSRRLLLPPLLRARLPSPRRRRSPSSVSAVRPPASSHSSPAACAAAAGWSPRHALLLRPRLYIYIFGGLLE